MIRGSPLCTVVVHVYQPRQKKNTNKATFKTPIRKRTRTLTPTRSILSPAPTSPSSFHCPFIVTRSSLQYRKANTMALVLGGRLAFIFLAEGFWCCYLHSAIAKEYTYCSIAIVDSALWQSPKQYFVGWVNIFFFQVWPLSFFESDHVFLWVWL